MWRAAKWFTWAAFGVFCALAFGVVVPLPISPTQTHHITQSDAVRHQVLIMAGPIHTDIAFPANRDVRDAFGFMAKDGLDPEIDGVKWIIAGWGGREFYINTPTWSDLKPWPVFRALTLDQSVMHVSLAGGIKVGASGVEVVHLSGRQFNNLIDAVKASFSTEPDGKPIVIGGKNYHRFDRFYEANGSFNLLLGCNAWTAKMLRNAGISTGIWTPLPQLLFWSLKLHNPPWRVRPASHISSVGETQ